MSNYEEFSCEEHDMPSRSKSSFDKRSFNDLPSAVDWREQGAVASVKDQGMCGSCWAFSAIGALEGMWKLYGDGKLYNLSEQQLVDCSENQGNYGCGGGLMDYAFNYTMQLGACTDEDYPYVGDDDDCRDSTCKSVVKTKGCANLWTGDSTTTEQVLNYMVSMHPVSIAVSAGSPIWMNYQSGVVNDTSCYGGGLDHGVVVVGYNRSTDGSGYWIVKNSWGTDWGMNGYIYLGMDSNICGVAEDPSFPLIDY